MRCGMPLPGAFAIARLGARVNAYADHGKPVQTHMLADHGGSGRLWRLC